MRMRWRIEVIEDGKRKEVIMDIGILKKRIGEEEGGGLKMVCWKVEGFEEKKLKENNGFWKKVKIGIKSDRMGELMMDIELKMVLKVMEKEGEVGKKVDEVLIKMRGRKDEGKNKKFGRVDGRGGNNKLEKREDGGKGEERIDLKKEGEF